jgi:hypothetical protein
VSDREQRADERERRAADAAGGGGQRAATDAGSSAPSEDELRAQLEEELRKVTVRDVLLQTVVSLVNLAGQRLGLVPEMRDQRDLDQARLAIDAVRALLPLLEEHQPEQLQPVRDALAQLQIAYAREVGAAEAAPPAEGPQPGPAPERGGADTGGTQGPQRRGGSGRLWVPPGSAT